MNLFNVPMLNIKTKSLFLICRQDMASKCACSIHINHGFIKKTHTNHGWKKKSAPTILIQ